MNRFRALIPIGLALLLTSAILAPSASAQPATLPTWQVGQEVAYGVNVPIGQELAPLLQQIRNDPSVFNITHLNALNVTGSLDTWVDQQVTVATGTYYVLHTIEASGLKLTVVFNATFDNLPQAGTYPGTKNLSGLCDPVTIPRTTGIVAVSFDITSLSTSDGTTNFAVSNLAIQNDTTNSTDQMKANLDLFHIPVQTTNGTTCVTTVTYRSENLGMSVDTHNQIRTLFSPALDVFHFPISNNGSWSASSNATFAGTFNGTIDVTGVSAADEKAFFDNLTQAFQSVPGLAVSGLDHFPIDLSQISVVTGGVSVFDHGRLHDTPPVPLSLNLRAKEGNMSLADNQFHEVFYIFQDPGTSCPPTAFAAIYSPTYPSAGHGMVVGFAAITCSGGVVQPLFELQSTPPSTARGHIRDTETNYAVFPPATTNTFADFFLQAPYWGLLIIAAVVIVVVALVLMRRRRRPAMVPVPPPAPPSPPSP